MSLLLEFNRQCTLIGDKTAFAETTRAISYQQVRLKASQLSKVLLTRERAHKRVAIALERGIEAATAIFGVLGAGGCYVPLDLQNPPGRQRNIIEDADVNCVIGRGHCPAWLENQASWLDIDRPLPSGFLADWPVDVEADSLAALLYTSGSTGQPKGVALCHRAMMNFSRWAAEKFNISSNDSIASLAPLHFDLSVFDIFTSLSRGATVHFVPSSLAMAPSRLTTWLSKQSISVFYTVPSLLSFIALKGSLSDTPLPSLRVILFAGEVFPTPRLKLLCELLPFVDFYNLYGPTETNVCCYWPVARQRLETDRPIPIGYPACGADLRIDEKSGELQVRSANNLSGYWRQGRLIQAMEQDHYFHTGDRVSLNEQGEYCYHGRLDRMLKCSGYRVEPAEIENVIQQCPEVVSCAVTGINDSSSGQRPAAILVLESSHGLEPVIKHVKQCLPSYMHPTKFIVLDSIPCLANGKIDYQGLKRQMENG
ncbi:MAG: amino acid adenylation domain-containing protein [Pseudomonadales bacterium]|nr:amino acid adenylation domain-containing protein [Pseudomonadales bacterium]